LDVHLMIIKGSLNYTTSGRKKRVIKKVKKEHEFKELKLKRREERNNYPSGSSHSGQTNKRQFPKVSGVTISVPYNKGPYQVVPQSDIKYIGK